ncbi:hypothetical protein HMPREF2757_09865 [Brevibacterium sp. HMSC063G07]|nr:hypothetical protein HMPREF2757_09865 [Brevibacterium sp. HMSC063G07]
MAVTTELLTVTTLPKSLLLIESRRSTSAGILELPFCRALMIPIVQSIIAATTMEHNMNPATLRKTESLLLSL